MPTIAGPLTADGALLTVRVSLSRTTIRQMQAAIQAVPMSHEFTGLVDTGSDSTFVDSSVVRRVPLPLSGFPPANIPALGGISICIQRDAGLTIIHPSGNAAFDLVLPVWKVYEQGIGALGYDILIGRDILTRCDFHYLGRHGRFEMEY